MRTSPQLAPHGPGPPAAAHLGSALASLVRPLNAAQWLARGAIHNGLHRRQIESIIAGLKAPGTTA